MTWKEDVCSFRAIVTIIFTGLMISETVIPLLGVTATQNGLWRGVHTAAANLFILLDGPALALVREPAAAFARHARNCAPNPMSVVVRDGHPHSLPVSS